jgi:diguanylate cyclase
MKRVKQLFSRLLRPRDKRGKALLWGFFACLVIGVIELGMPADLFLRNVRDQIREQHVSDDYVVVGLDDKSLKALKATQFDRNIYAQLTQKLDSVGPKEIYYDVVFVGESSPKSDRALINAFAEAETPIIIAADHQVLPSSKQPKNLLPLPALAEHAKVANISLNLNFFGQVKSVYDHQEIGEQTYPSMALLLSGKDRPVGGSVSTDYAMDTSDVPVYSLIDVLNDRVDPRGLADKKILIAPVEGMFGDVFNIPGKSGRLPGVFVHIIAAETIKNGVFTDFGWLMPLLVTALLVSILQLPMDKKIRLGLRAGCWMIVLAGPLAAEYVRITGQFFPAMVLLIVEFAQSSWAAYGRRSTRTSIVSGLANINALLDLPTEPNTVLCVATIRNFAEIKALVTHTQETELFQQIANRLELGTQGAKLHHSDDGAFAWLMQEDEKAALSDKFQALTALLIHPVQVGGRLIDVNVSFGVDQTNDRSLANRFGSARLAADEAADEGLRWKAYDPSKLDNAEWRLSLLSRLDTAIDNNEVWVAFQPQVDLSSNRINGAEALARWSDPQRGDISPDDFIAVAEQHNRIEKLTDHVLAISLEAASDLASQGHSIPISVNMSARLLESPMIVHKVQAALEEFEVPPQLLTLELTETAKLSRKPEVMERMKQLRELGVGLSIDDYGTGFSNLDYIQHVPANEIKLDRSLIKNIERSGNDRIVVRSTIKLVKSLGMKVVAEGVEDQTTMQLLRRMECHAVQGYLVGAPMNLDELLVRLSSQQKISVAA